MQCTYCEHHFATEVAKCPLCGYPVQGTCEERKHFLFLKQLTLKTQMDDTLELVGKSKYIMYFAAVISLIGAFMVFMKYGVSAVSIILGIVIALIACALFVLGYYVERNPVRNTTIGFIAALLVIGGGMIGWLALLAMAFCVISAFLYKRKKRAVDALQAKIDAS